MGLYKKEINPSEVQHNYKALDVEALVTASCIRKGLETLGLKQGDIVCVHSSLSRFGTVLGGPQTVIDSILSAVGDSGTVMMPAFTRDFADPAEWKYPPAPPEYVDLIQQEMPGFNPDTSPAYNIGKVCELFRCYPKTIRSQHPISSFSACGPDAKYLLKMETLSNRFGKKSPLGKLVDLNGKVLLLGAPYDTMSLLHLTQYAMEWSVHVNKKAIIETNGLKSWVEFSDVEFPDDWAEDALEMLIDSGLATTFYIGKALCILVDAKQVVDAVITWRNKNAC